MYYIELCESKLVFIIIIIISVPSVPNIIVPASL